MIKIKIDMIKTIKQGILLFWAIWFFLVFLANFADGLKALHFLPDTWSFASGNFPFMKQVTAVYGTPVWITSILYGMILFGEITVASSFFYAFFLWTKQKKNALFFINKAFAIGLLFWGVFLVGDEFFVAYTVETNHQNLTNLMLLSALFFYCIPNKAGDIE